jgi:formylmethanofuran dehydrogenase subunit A
MFELPRYVIHAGEVVVEDGEIRSTPNGRLFHVAPGYDESALPHIREWFERYYTVQFRNYPVDDQYLQDHEVVASSGGRSSR